MDVEATEANRPAKRSFPLTQLRQGGPPRKQPRQIEPSEPNEFDDDIRRVCLNDIFTRNPTRTTDYINARQKYSQLMQKCAESEAVPFIPRRRFNQHALQITNTPISSIPSSRNVYGTEDEKLPKEQARAIGNACVDLATYADQCGGYPDVRTRVLETQIQENPNRYVFRIPNIRTVINGRLTDVPLSQRTSLSKR
jgi:hypothetical protein